MIIEEITRSSSVPLKQYFVGWALPTNYLRPSKTLD